MTRAVVAGGAGFLGSHLCRRLLAEGWEVVAVDSFITGRRANLEGLEGTDGFRLVESDITDRVELDGSVDWVFNLASPASPIDYLEKPIETLRVGSAGTFNTLGFALAKGASYFLASTSEVYGDPQVHPQPESYWGNVNPTGPRSVYDESKRFAEAAVSAYRRKHEMDVRIVRIFNTYGESMRRNDGRAVPTFIAQALKGEPLTVHGDGSQTRSLCYVDDLIEGFWRLASSGRAEPTNIGNPEELTVLRLAETIRDALGSSSEIVFTERPIDDPEQRRPDISMARQHLGWEPAVSLEEGLGRTVEWAKQAWTDV